MSKRKRQIPHPIVNGKEEAQIKRLTTRYNKLISPNVIVRAGNKALAKAPTSVKEKANQCKTFISEREFIIQALKMATTGYQKLNEIAAKVTISKKTAVKRINKRITDEEISSFEEICLIRSYDIEKAVNRYRTSNILYATGEGAITGAFGFTGIVPNIVASTFLFFRAVQSIGTMYGYDVKNDPAEMEIATNVFMSAISPKQDLKNNELTSAIGKFMVFSETTTVKQTANKTWTAMAERGGLSSIIAQIRALANKSAAEAIKNAGIEGLENNAFRRILEQLGKRLSLKETIDVMPIVGGVFGAAFDAGQMSKITEYADIFYHKRFLEEKEERIKVLNEDNG